MQFLVCKIFSTCNSAVGEYVKCKFMYLMMIYVVLSPYNRNSVFAHYHCHELQKSTRNKEGRPAYNKRLK